MGVTGNSPKKSKRASPKKSDVQEETYDEVAEELDNVNEEQARLPANEAEKGAKQVIPKLAAKSKAKTKKSKNIKDVKKSPKVKKGALSEEETETIEESLQKFFRESFGKSSSNVFDAVSAHAQLRRYMKGDTIVVKGETGRGVYVVLKGKVSVATSDLTITIDTLKTGDIFGELSSMYDIPSTANVIAASEAEVVCVPKGLFRKLLEDFDVTKDIIDWCIHRRYLPTSDFIDSDRAYRRMAFKTLRKLDFFMAWPNNALKTLILSFEHQLVLLYPAESVIILQDDPLTNMICVIKGTVEISHGPRKIAKIEVNRRDKPFVFGEFGLSDDNQVACVSTKAKEECQVILIPKGNVLQVTEEFPSLQNNIIDKKREQLQFMKRLGHVYKQSQPDVQEEVLFYIVQQSNYYANRPEAEIRKKIRQGVYREFDTGSTVFLGVEQESMEAFLVLRGEVEFKKNGEIAEGEIEKHVISERTVIPLKDVQLSSIKATRPTLILKLPKVVRRPNQEEDNLELV